jgi:hypothetical protein
MTRNVMLTDDYLIRQINIYLAALANIVGLKTAYMYVEAQLAVDQALEEIFGLPANLLRQMDDDAILEAATHLDVLNLDKLQAAADVFREEGELLEMRGSPEQAVQSYTRALNFYLDAVLNGGAWNLPDPTDKIEWLIDKLAATPLDPDTQYGLYLYAEKQGQWHRAEWLLDRLAQYPDLKDEAVRLRTEFYAKLARLDEAALVAGNLTRTHVLAQAAKYGGEPG